MDSYRITHRRLFASLFLAFVASGPLLLLIHLILPLLLGNHGEVLQLLVMVVIWLWFMPPGLLFPVFFHREDCGSMNPNDWLGWLVAICFYSVVITLVWLPFGLVRNKDVRKQ